MENHKQAKYEKKEVIFPENRPKEKKREGYRHSVKINLPSGTKKVQSKALFKKSQATIVI